MSDLVRLAVIEDRFQVARMAPTASVPDVALAAAWFSITRTDEELSLVVPEAVDLTGLADKVETGWAALKVLGPLAFELTGIVAGLAKVLAEADIAIFVLSTFDTDILLVKADQLPATISALRNAGYQVAP